MERTSGSVFGVVNLEEKWGEESVEMVVKLVVVGMRARTSAICAFRSLISAFFCSTRPSTHKHMSLSDPTKH